jgi:hypothetical protein
MSPPPSPCPYIPLTRRPEAAKINTDILFAGHCGKPFRDLSVEPGKVTVDLCVHNQTLVIALYLPFGTPYCL